MEIRSMGFRIWKRRWRSILKILVCDEAWPPLWLVMPEDKPICSSHCKLRTGAWIYFWTAPMSHAEKSNPTVRGTLTISSMNLENGDGYMRKFGGDTFRSANVSVPGRGGRERANSCAQSTKNTVRSGWTLDCQRCFRVYCIIQTTTSWRHGLFFTIMDS